MWWRYQIRQYFVKHIELNVQHSVCLPIHLCMTGQEFMVVPTVKKWETGKGSSLESCLQHCTHGYCHLFLKGLPNTISYQYWGANCCWAALWGISKWNSTYKSAWVFWKLKLRERHMWGRSTSVCFCLQTIMAQQLNQILDCQYA